MLQSSDMTSATTTVDLRSRLLDRIQTEPDRVWTPGDFVDLGGRAAVDKALQRLAPWPEISAALIVASMIDLERIG